MSGSSPKGSSSRTVTAGYLHFPNQEPSPKRMCRRGCVEYPDGKWSLCAWHEDKAQWAARETHRHGPECPQCAALAVKPESSTVPEGPVSPTDVPRSIHQTVLAENEALEDENARLRAVSPTDGPPVWRSPVSPTPDANLRNAIEASMNDFGLGTTERIDRAVQRIIAVAFAPDRVGRALDDHYRARRAADPSGPSVHECGSYCGRDLAERLEVTRESE